MSKVRFLSLIRPFGARHADTLRRALLARLAAGLVLGAMLLTVGAALTAQPVAGPRELFSVHLTLDDLFPKQD